MAVNCVNIGREDESLNIGNTNLLVRFNKTRDIFHSVTQILIIPLTIERKSKSKECVPKIPCLISAASYAQR